MSPDSVTRIPLSNEVQQYFHFSIADNYYLFGVLEVVIYHNICNSILKK